MALADFSLNDIGSLFTGIRESLTGEKIKDPQAVLGMLNKIEGIVIKAKGSIIEAEAKSEHWIVSAWRPITMLVFVFIVANNYIIAPYATVLFSVVIPTLELPPDMWELLKLGISGYIVGRSAEKVMKVYKGNN